MIIILSENQIVQMGLILEEKDNPKMGAGVLPICKKTGKILIGKRGPKITSPNEWATYGGMAKEGESPLQAAKREFKEETGYKGYIQMHKIFINTKKSGLKFHNYLGIVDSEFKPKINVKTVDGDVEFTDYKWLYPNEVEDIKGKIHFGLSDILKKEKKKIEKYAK